MQVADSTKGALNEQKKKYIFTAVNQKMDLDENLTHLKSHVSALSQHLHGDELEMFPSGKTKSGLRRGI